MKTPITQRLAVFGANLRDQSLGQFVVHSATCADCAKLKGEQRHDRDYSSLQEVGEDIWSDHIAEGSLDRSEALDEIWFAPCVRLPRIVTPDVDVVFIRR